jgi:hypothetical protein
MRRVFRRASARLSQDLTRSMTRLTLSFMLKGASHALRCGYGDQSDAND